MMITISAAWLIPLLPVLGCVYLAGWRHGFASAKEIAAPALEKLQRILNGESINDTAVPYVRPVHLPPGCPDVTRPLPTRLPSGSGAQRVAYDITINVAGKPEDMPGFEERLRETLKKAAKVGPS